MLSVNCGNSIEKFEFVTFFFLFFYLLIDEYFVFYSDETTTVNRQPEFTQLDIELSFTSPNDIINLIENVLLESWPKELGTITVPFNRMSFNDAMDKYGSDKPDTRYSQLLVKIYFKIKKIKFGTKMNFFFQLRDVTSALSETLNVDNCKKFAAYAIPVQRTSVAGLSQALELNFKATAQQNKINFVKIKIDEVKIYLKICSSSLCYGVILTFFFCSRPERAKITII